MPVLVQIVILLLLVLANGLFAMAEIAIVSARKGRLQAMAETGQPGAAAALQLAESPNRFLSTVQVGITLIGTLAGVFGGASLAKPLAELLEEVPWLAPYSDTLSLGLVVLIITYLSLVLGELAPKRIALTNAERIGAAVARPMMALSRLTAPLISLLSISTGAVIRLLGIRASDEPPVTEQEILLMLEEGRQAGVFEAAEQNIVENVFRFADRRVAALITPYTELVWLDVHDSPETHWQQILSSPHNCFPVADDDLDNLLGFVCIRDIWQAMLRQEGVDLRALVRPPLMIPENVSALRLLTMFRQHAVQGALIVDEHGSILGLVTLTDVLESLIGEMPDDIRDEDAPITQRDANSWLVDGLLPVDEFEDYFGVDIAHADEQAYQTVGGFIMNHLGRIPEAADVLVWGGLRFEVMDMDDMRVDKIIVEQVSSPAEDDMAG